MLYKRVIVTKNNKLGRWKKKFRLIAATSLWSFRSQIIFFFVFFDLLFFLVIYLLHINNNDINNNKDINNNNNNNNKFSLHGVSWVLTNLQMSLQYYFTRVNKITTHSSWMQIVVNIKSKYQIFGWFEFRT